MAHLVFESWLETNAPTETRRHLRVRMLLLNYGEMRGFTTSTLLYRG